MSYNILNQQVDCPFCPVVEGQPQHKMLTCPRAKAFRFGKDGALLEVMFRDVDELPLEPLSPDLSDFLKNLGEVSRIRSEPGPKLTS